MAEERAQGPLWALAAVVGLWGARWGAWLATPSPDMDTPGPDLVPLWLGAHALRRGMPPEDPTLLPRLWSELGAGVFRGTFWNPYPATASLVAMPITLLSWPALYPVHWIGSAAALLLCGVGALAGPATSRASAALGVAVAVASVVQLEVARHTLALGQVNAVVVLLTTVAAVALARGGDRVAGALFAVGLALKGFPALLLAAALPLRRWRAVAAWAVGSLAIGAATWSLHPRWRPWLDVSRALDQVSHGDPRLRALDSVPYWSWRMLPVAILGVPLLVALARRRDEPRARAAVIGLVLAAMGAAFAGVAPPHEMLLLVPALVFAIGWPVSDGWAGPAGVGAAVLLALSMSPLDRYPTHQMSSRDHAAPLIVAVFLVACGRAVAALRQRAAVSSVTTNPISSSSAPRS